LLLIHPTHHGVIVKLATQPTKRVLHSYREDVVLSHGQIKAAYKAPSGILEEYEGVAYENYSYKIIWIFLKFWIAKNQQSHETE
jgi:hypothetical protein